MKKKIVTLALALVLGSSSLIVRPVKAIDINDCAYKIQSPSSQIMKLVEPIDTEPRG